MYVSNRLRYKYHDHHCNREARSGRKGTAFTQTKINTSERQCSRQRVLLSFLFYVLLLAEVDLFVDYHQCLRQRPILKCLTKTKVSKQL